MNNCRYFDPSSLEDALELLNQFGNEAMLIAGGTDLLMDVAKRGKPRSHLINLTSIAALNGIDVNGHLRVGATTTHHTLNRSEIVQSHYQMLCEASGSVGSRQIRNLATIGGNVCNALPCADTVPALVAARAKAELTSRSGQRMIEIEKFITGPRQTVLEEGEILTGFYMPNALPYTGSAYKTFTPRKALDLTVVGVAVCITLNPDNQVIKTAQIAIGNMAPSPVLASEASQMLTGQTLSDRLLKECSEAAVRACRARDSAVRASAEYRKELVRVLVKHAVNCAVERANPVLATERKS